MMKFPYNLKLLKDGNPDAVAWAKSLTDVQMKEINQECINFEEDSYLYELYSVICDIRENKYDFGQKIFYSLAKSAFFDGDGIARDNIATSLNINTRIRQNESNGEYAYRLWYNSCDGRVLAYALLLGITTADARRLSRDKKLKSPWDYRNGDRKKVHRDLIDTLLYEDCTVTKWKKAPRDVLRELIEDGISHPGFSSFLHKYKHRKWAKQLIRKDKTKDVTGCLIMIAVGVVPCLFTAYLVGKIALFLGRLCGIIESTQFTSKYEIVIVGICVCIVLALVIVIYKTILKKMRK